MIVPRILYGANESSPVAVRTDVPEGFRANSFLTLRFRYHKESVHVERSFTGAGKALVNASAYAGKKPLGIHKGFEHCWGHLTLIFWLKLKSAPS